MNAFIGATMRKAWFGAVLCLITLAAVPAHAQLSTGIGGGAGFGSRGDSAGAGHAVAFVELSLPLIPGVRVEGFVVDAPTGVGRFATVASGVFSLPVPVITPYLIAGWGTYGFGAPGPRSGWNLGAGVHTALPAGPSVFVEIRRHDQVSRDLITVGLRF